MATRPSSIDCKQKSNIERLFIHWRFLTELTSGAQITYESKGTPVAVREWFPGMIPWSEDLIPSTRRPQQLLDSVSKILVGRARLWDLGALADLGFLDPL